jgi:hypothetical protein
LFIVTRLPVITIKYIVRHPELNIIGRTEGT